MKSAARKLQVCTGCFVVALLGLATSARVRAEIPLADPATTGGWEVTTSGRANSYASVVFGQTVNTSGLGNVVPDPNNPMATDRYILVGPQVGIQGNPTPSGAVANTVTDTHVNTPRIRGGFASTILAFNIYKQLSPGVKLTFKVGLWAGIQNGLVGGVRQQNDVGAVDWREQYMKLELPWGILWGGRLIGLFNRGGMRVDWYLIHQHGVGHPCNVDSSGTTSCGGTGVGSLHPNRNAQLAYSTPDLGGFQLTVAVLDPSMIDTGWNRTTIPRVESEATFQRKLSGTNEINLFANGMAQIIGRVSEVAPNPLSMEPGIPADATRLVMGYGGGGWFRVNGFGLGGTGWGGKGLGTANAFGNTAIDEHGTLRQHFGYLGAANFRVGNFEIAASYGSSNVKETPWDRDPSNPRKISVIKEVRGISGKLAYHMTPVVFSIDGMNIRNEWHRGEVQVANVISAGFLGEW